MKRLVVRTDKLDEGPGFSYVWQGVPFTGLAVDLRGDGSVESVTEVVEGREHGYGIDFDAKSRPRYIVQSYGNRKHGLLAEWDQQGRLICAERREENFLTQELQIDPKTGTTTVVDRPENATAIAEARSQLTVQSPPMTKSIPELLADFEKAFPVLLNEAKQGLGLV